MNAFRRFFIRWYYRRIFHKLYWHFLNRGISSSSAAYEAMEAFLCLSPYRWEELFPEYREDVPVRRENE